jgi:hypothetical protein
VIVSDTFPRSAMFYVEDEPNAGLGEFLLLIGAVSIACPVHTGKLRPFPLARTIAEVDFQIGTTMLLARRANAVVRWLK